jgi:hypothetical protein
VEFRLEDPERRPTGQETGFGIGVSLWKRLPRGGAFHVLKVDLQPPTEQLDFLVVPLSYLPKHPVSHLECMAGTTGLEPATSAVTESNYY